MSSFGDVMGHDIAATAMSQIRAALRAVASQGPSPATVLHQLDRLVDAFALADLVTVEVPGTSLEDSLHRLGATVGGNGSPEKADGLCERVLAALLEQPSHDDVAVLAIEIGAIGSKPPMVPHATRVNLPFRIGDTVAEDTFGRARIPRRIILDAIALLTADHRSG